MKKVFKWIKRVFFAILLLILLVAVPILMNTGYEAIRSSFLTDQEKWQEDIDRVDYLIRNEFPVFEKFIDTEEYSRIINALRLQIKEDTSFTKEMLQLEIIKLVAAFKDPHTIVYNFREVLSATFPYRLDWYDSAFYLTSGKLDDPNWLGAKVIKIEDKDPFLFYENLKRYTNAPNETSHAYFMAMFLPLPAVLFHEGLIDSREEVEITLEKNGEVKIFSFKAISQDEKNALTDYQTLSKKYADSEKPLFRKRSNENYWFTFLEKENAMYLRYSQCVAQGDIEEFWGQLFAGLDEHKPEKFIIDIRGNPGGDSQNNVTLVQQINARPWLNARGKLFTITDRGTGSAAVSLTSDLEIYTNTILVGEKPVDRANTTSDPTFFTLPHTGLTLLLPNLFSLHSHIYDQRDGISPEWVLPASLAGDGYLEDLAMDSIVSYVVDYPSANLATLPAASSGIYSFSPLQNLSVFQKDSIWKIAIDGLFEAPIYARDSVYYTEKFDMRIEGIGNDELPIRLFLHGSEIVAERLETNMKSIVALIDAGDFESAETKLNDLKINGQPPFYLDRPFFQNRVYTIYHTHGFNKAFEFNRVYKNLYPHDPVGNIIDFELYQYEGGNFFGKTKSFFSVLNNLLRRYYLTITSDRIMNDDYNAFIGTE